MKITFCDPGCRWEDGEGCRGARRGRTPAHRHGPPAGRLAGTPWGRRAPCAPPGHVLLPEPLQGLPAVCGDCARLGCRVGSEGGLPAPSLPEARRLLLDVQDGDLLHRSVTPPDRPRRLPGTSEFGVYRWRHLQGQGVCDLSTGCRGRAASGQQMAVFFLVEFADSASSVKRLLV